MSLDLNVELKYPPTPLFTNRGHAVVLQELTAAVEYGVTIASAAIIPKTPINTGALRAAIQTSVTGTSVEVTGRVFDPLPYALPVELGSRPHWPPPGPIQMWVRRKLGVPENEVRAVAFLVARKIARRGTPARRMFTQGFKEAEGRIKARMDAALVRVAQRLGGNE